MVKVRYRDIDKVYRSFESIFQKEKRVYVLIFFLLQNLYSKFLIKMYPIQKISQNIIKAKVFPLIQYKDRKKLMILNTRVKVFGIGVYNI